MKVQLAILVFILTIIAPVADTQAAVAYVQSMVESKTAVRDYPEVRRLHVLKEATKWVAQDVTVLIFNTTLQCFKPEGITNRDETIRWCVSVEMWHNNSGRGADHKFGTNEFFCTQYGKAQKEFIFPVHQHSFGGNENFTMRPYLKIFHDCTFMRNVRQYIRPLENITEPDEMAIRSTEVFLFQNGEKWENVEDHSLYPEVVYHWKRGRFTYEDAEKYLVDFKGPFEH